MNTTVAGSPATLLMLGLRHKPFPVETGAKRVVIVEPDAARLGMWPQQNAGTRPVVLHSCALGPTHGDTVLHVMNFGALNSLRPASGALHGLLPGLRELQRQPVPQRSFSDLLGDPALLERPLYIEIDSPGSEQDILGLLRDADILARVDQLQLRCGIEVFHEGGADCSTLTAWLESEGFLVSLSDSQDDPDWPVLFAIPRPGPSETERNASLLAEALAMQAALQQQLAEAAQKQTEQVAERDGLLIAAQERLSALTERADTAEAQHAKQEAYLVDELGRRDVLLVEAQSKIEALMAQTRAAEVQRAEQETQLVDELRRRDALLAEAQSKIEALTAQTQAAEVQRAEQEAHLVDELRRRDTLLSEAQARIAELDVLTRRDIAMAMRNQTMAQNDLRDLQGRFSVLQNLCQRQEGLLRQLAPRLQEAAEHLRGQSERQALVDAMQKPLQPLIVKKDMADTATKKKKGGKKSAKKA